MEDPFKLIIGIATKLHISVFYEDLMVCYRVGKSRAGKPRPILVKFENVQARNMFFNARKQLKKHDVKYLQKVYVNEDLAPMRSTMFHLARNLKNQDHVAKYWIYDCEVWIRDAKDTDATRVRYISDLKNHLDTPPCAQ